DALLKDVPKRNSSIAYHWRPISSSMKSRLEITDELRTAVERARAEYELAKASAHEARHVLNASAGGDASNAIGAADRTEARAQVRKRLSAEDLARTNYASAIKKLNDFLLHNKLS